MSVTVLESCTGCGRCLPVCPERALTLETESADGFGEKRAVVNASLCTDCGECLPVCPHEALKISC